MTLSLGLIVLKACDPENLVSFYTKLGLDFQEEKHGTGPVHHACLINNAVLEIYPRLPNSEGTTETRLGFNVACLDEALENLSSHCEIMQPPRKSKWGRRSVVRDPEGHRIELLEVGQN